MPKGYAHLRSVSNRGCAVPNLENLRKQAKLFVRWHRSGYYPVAAQIRVVLPRFRHLTDQQVLDQQLRLSDAQELVALQSGFQSWPALKKGVQAMTDNTAATIPASVLGGIEAQVFVADIAAACEFYVARLGFTLAFTYGEPTFYAQLF